MIFSMMCMKGKHLAKTYNFTIKVRIVQMVYYYYKMVQVRQWYYVTSMKQK